MPNTKSSKKDKINIERNRVRNQSVRSKVKTLRHNALDAVKAGGEGIVEVARIAEKALDSAAGKGIIHKNTAARRKSRMMKKVNMAIGV